MHSQLCEQESFDVSTDLISHKDCPVSGDTMEVPFIYQHRPPVGGVEVKDFTIQTSEFRSLGLDIEFFIECDGYANSCDIRVPFLP